MKKHLFFILLFFCVAHVYAQPVQVDIFQSQYDGPTVTFGVRARATGANVDYIGVTFYMLYQSANASPLSTGQNTVGGVNDSRMTTTFGWGTSARFTNPQQVVNIDPGPPGGITYDRRYVYGNIDETGGSNVRTLTNSWDTLLYITLNALQVGFPQGGYVYQQNTSEAPGAALSDPGFANIPYNITSGDVALGGTVPVLFTKFGAQCSTNGTLISWATAQEANSSKFEIERSLNGTDWRTVATVPAAGNSNAERNYQQLDLNGGTAFYRIKQVDKNGNFIYTGVERTNCDVKSITSVIYPVPAKDILTVVIKSDRAINTRLLVFDITGKVVKEVRAQVLNGNNTFRVNLQGLTSGDYIIKSSDAAIDLNKVFTIAR